MQEKKSIRQWVKDEGRESKMSSAIRIVKKLGIGEIIGGRTGTLLTADEWKQVKIALYGGGN